MIYNKQYMICNISYLIAKAKWLGKGERPKDREQFLSFLGCRRYSLYPSLSLFLTNYFSGGELASHQRNPSRLPCLREYVGGIIIGRIPTEKGGNEVKVMLKNIFKECSSRGGIVGAKKVSQHFFM